MARDYPAIRQAFVPAPAMPPPARPEPTSRPTDPASFYAMLAGHTQVEGGMAASAPGIGLATATPVSIAANPVAAMEMAPSQSAPVVAEPDWNHLDRRERGYLVATGHVDPASKRDSQFFGTDGFTFDDFVDIINPLHHVPLIGSLYRWATGDTISPGSAIIGAGLLGGPIGLIGGAISAAVTEANGGKNMADAAVASVLDGGGPDTTVMAAATPEAAAAFVPSAGPGTERSAAAGGIPLDRRPTEFRLPPTGTASASGSLFDGIATPTAPMPAEDAATIKQRMAEGLAKYNAMSSAPVLPPPDPNEPVELDEAAIEILLRQSM